MSNNNLKFNLHEGTISNVANQISAQLKEQGCSFHYSGTEVLEVNENFVNSMMKFILKVKAGSEKEYKIPVIFETKDYARSFIRVIEELKISLLYNIAEAVKESTVAQTECYENKGTITPNQKTLLYDKMKKPNFKEIINKKLKSLGVSSIEDLSKEDASSVIDLLPRGGNR